MPLSPDIQKQLEALENDAQRAKYLRDQADALTAEADEARKVTRERFKAKYAARYKDVDVKAALTGAAVTYGVKMGAATYVISPPTGATTRAVDALAEKKISNGEAVVLAWLRSLQLEGMPAQDIHKQPLEDRLKALRELPEFVLSRLAEECSTLQAYLSTCLELDLGN